MAPRSKQSDRKELKKTKSQPVDEEVTGEASGRFLDLAKTLAMGSVLVGIAPKLPAMVNTGIAIVKDGKKPEQPKADEKENAEEKENEQEADEKTEKETAAGTVPDYIEKNDICGIFGMLCSRLHWSNLLGLALPTSGEESLKAWSAFKGLQIDFGPRAKRKGNAGFERISTNLYKNLPQYLHILLALMILRAFLFRSYFACLPWLAFYQFVSTFLPLTELPKLPQLPLSKVPVEFRVAATVGLNGLLQFFFVYELVWKSWFFEKFLVLGLLAYHAYAVRPVEA